MCLFGWRRPSRKELLKTNEFLLGLTVHAAFKQMATEDALDVVAKLAVEQRACGLKVIAAFKEYLKYAPPESMTDARASVMEAELVFNKIIEACNARREPSTRSKPRDTPTGPSYPGSPGSPANPGSGSDNCN